MNVPDILRGGLTPRELVEKARIGRDVWKGKHSWSYHPWKKTDEERAILRKYPNEIKTIEELSKVLNQPKIRIAYWIVNRDYMYPTEEAMGVIQEHDLEKRQRQMNYLARSKQYSKEKNSYTQKRVAPKTSIRKWIFNRDGNRCVVCGSHDKLVMEHILPAAYLKEAGVSWADIFTSFNLATVCRECSLLRHRPRKLLWDKETLDLVRERHKLREREIWELGEPGDLQKTELEYQRLTVVFKRRLEGVKERTRARRELIEKSLGASWILHARELGDGDTGENPREV